MLSCPRDSRRGGDRPAGRGCSREQLIVTVYGLYAREPGGWLSVAAARPADGRARRRRAGGALVDLPAQAPRHPRRPARRRRRRATRSRRGARDPRRGRRAHLRRPAAAARGRLDAGGVLGAGDRAREAAPAAVPAGLARASARRRRACGSRRRTSPTRPPKCWHRSGWPATSICSAATTSAFGDVEHGGRDWWDLDAPAALYGEFLDRHGRLRPLAAPHASTTPRRSPTTSALLTDWRRLPYPTRGCRWSCCPRLERRARGGPVLRAARAAGRAGAHGHAAPAAIAAEPARSAGSDRDALDLDQRVGVPEPGDADAGHRRVVRPTSRRQTAPISRACAR